MLSIRIHFIIIMPSYHVKHPINAIVEFIANILVLVPEITIEARTVQRWFWFL